MSNSLNEAFQFILKGEPIIVPTDTVYGLVCRYDSKSAVEKIYKFKKRVREKPLILLGYNWKALKTFVIVGNGRDRSLRRLIKNHWPGPLTIVLPASKKTPKYLNRGFKTIGIRIPKNEFLLSLLKHCPRQVLASTSANISGKKNVQSIAKKVKLFIKARKNEMSFKPSKIIEITKKNIKTIR